MYKILVWNMYFQGKSCKKGKWLEYLEFMIYSFGLMDTASMDVNANIDEQSRRLYMTKIF